MRYLERKSSLTFFQEVNPPEFGLHEVTSHHGISSVSDGKNDFSNPMFDAMNSMESAAANYVIPSGDSSGSSTGSGSRSGGGSPASTLAASGYMEPPSAILAPSSVTHKSSPQLAIRHKELAPSTVDTGKDTQCLVTEDDSEC